MLRCLSPKEVLHKGEKQSGTLPGLRKKQAKETRKFWKEMATTSWNAKKASNGFKKRHHCTK